MKNYKKLHEQAKKICFAVVITMYVLAIAYYVLETNGLLEWLQPKTVVIYTAHASTSEVKNDPVANVKDEDRLADLIYLNESSRGKNNYSKCTDGKVNFIGFNIPGNGTYQCFNSHEDEMIVLKGWILDKLSRGWGEQKILCTYSGNNYSGCK